VVHLDGLRVTFYRIIQPALALHPHPDVVDLFGVRHSDSTGQQPAHEPAQDLKYYEDSHDLVFG
jgi:hypothetical protein